MTYDLIPLKHATLLLAHPIGGSVVVAGDVRLTPSDACIFVWIDNCSICSIRLYNNGSVKR